MDLTAIIRSLPGPILFGSVVILTAMAGAAIAAAVTARRRAALMADTPASPIAFAEDGYRSFEGTAEAPGGLTLTSPLTGVSCCWYSVTLERFTRRKESTSSWRVVRQATSSAPFLVRDSTGVCAVYPLGAEVMPTDQAVWTGATEVPDDRSPARVPGGASTTRMVEIAGTAGTQYRYSEQCIYPGDPLVLLGAFHSGRFAAQDDPDDDEDDEFEVEGAEEGEESGDAEAEPGGAAWAEADRFDEAAERAGAAARGWMAQEGSRSFIISATPRDADVAMTAMGSQAAFGLAAVLLSVAALLLWVRLG